MKTNTDIIEEVKDIFSTHLSKNGLRRTPERYAILQKIYDREDHFEAERLYIDIMNDGFNVSKATVYNTLELLVSCDLIRKHTFDFKSAQYEKSYGYKQHDHLICVKCNKVIEFCDPRVQQIKNLMKGLFEFEITHHSLNLFGYCKTCQIKKNKKYEGNS